MSLNAANYSRLIYLTSGTAFVTPANWSAANNFIACVGGTASLGGGAYAQSNNVALIPYHSYQIQVGNSSLNNCDTWFGGANLASSIVGANGSIGATSGQASASTGQITFSGGNGSSGGGGSFFGGGGAAGPNGAGGPATYPNGGYGDGGVVPIAPLDGNGLSGNEFLGGFGCGGGGSFGSISTNGGNYGGGCGGSRNGVGTPAQGLIVIGYTPLNSGALLIGI